MKSKISITASEQYILSSTNENYKLGSIVICCVKAAKNCYHFSFRKFFFENYLENTAETKLKAVKRL